MTCMVVGPVLLPPGSLSESPTKRRRGRPLDSGKLQFIASLGEFLALQAKTEKLPFSFLFLFDMKYDHLMCLVLVILRLSHRYFLPFGTVSHTNFYKISLSAVLVLQIWHQLFTTFKLRYYRNARRFKTLLYLFKYLFL